LSARHVKVNERPAIPHKPLTTVDPKTGKRVAPDTLLTMPNGKKVKASEAFAELNRIEKKLNAVGHTLRDKSKRVVLQETILPREKMAEQSRKAAARYLVFDPKTMKPIPTHLQLRARHQAGLKTAAQRLAE